MPATRTPNKKKGGKKSPKTPKTATTASRKGQQSDGVAAALQHTSDAGEAKSSKEEVKRRAQEKKDREMAERIQLLADAAAANSLEAEANARAIAAAQAEDEVEAAAEEASQTVRPSHEVTFRVDRSGEEDQAEEREPLTTDDHPRDGQGGEEESRGETSKKRVEV